MLLQTNSYIVPKEKKTEHARVVRRFRQTLLRLGCDHFEVYEQVGSNWSNTESTGRYVQILRFIDRKHQLAVQAAERSDPTAQKVIQEFCDLINFPYQQQQGLFAVGFYTSVLPVAPKRGPKGELLSTVEHEIVPDEAEDEVLEERAVGPATHIDSADENGEETVELPAPESTGEIDLSSEEEFLEPLDDLQADGLELIDEEVIAEPAKHHDGEDHTRH